MRNAVWIATVYFFAGAAATALAEAAEPVRVGGAVRVEASLPIDGLFWDTSRPDLWLQEVAGRARIEIELSGRLAQPDWEIVCQEKTVKPDPEGRFRGLRVVVSAQDPFFSLATVGPRGTVAKGRYRVEFLDERVTRVGDWKAWTARRWAVTPEMSLSRISYAQTQVPEFDEWALTGKLAVQYSLVPERWIVSTSIFSNLAAFGLAEQTGFPSIRFSGVNLRLVHGFARLPEPWSASLGLGYYYTTTAASGHFGFKNMVGPQLQPAARRRFLNGSSVGGSFKFAAIADRFTVLSPANHEIALGVDYARPWSAGKSPSWGVSFSAAWLKLDYLGLEIRSTAVSFGVFASY